MNRREFLGLAGSAWAGAALPAVGSAAPAVSRSLGYSLYGMKSLGLDPALEACAAIGYRNVELTLMPGYAAEPSRLDARARRHVRAKLEATGLTVSSLMLNLSLVAEEAEQGRHLEAIRTAAQLAHDLAPDRPPLLETILQGHPADWAEGHGRMAERLRRWGAAAAAGGVSLALKAHTGQAVNSPERLLWLLQAAANPALCVIYDYSHFEMEGLGLEATLRQLLPQTRYIHAKDARRQAGQVEFLLPGEGDIDYAAYFRLLQKLGYDGPIVAEVSTQIFSRPHFDPIVAARSSFAVLAAAARAV